MPIEEALGRFARNVIDEIRANMGSRGSGRLAASLEHRITENGVQILASPYFQYAEVGRGSGRVPYSFQNILVGWIRFYSVPVPSKFKDELQFANAIKWKTIAEGSAKYRHSIPKDDYIRDAVDRHIDELAEDILEYEAVNINDQLDFS